MIRIRFTPAILFFFLLSDSILFALDPAKAITQYVHDVWRTEEGLPLNSVRSIVQTRDGYLWLTTGQGLARFDGVRFTVFDRTNTKAMNVNQFSALYEDRSGNLWIGSNGGGVTCHRDGKFTSFTTRHGLSENFILCVTGDSEGNIWIGSQGGGLTRFREGKFFQYTTRDGLAGNRINTVYSDRDGPPLDWNRIGPQLFAKGKVDYVFDQGRTFQ